MSMSVNKKQIDPSVKFQSRWNNKGLNFLGYEVDFLNLRRLNEFKVNISPIPTIDFQKRD